MNGANSNANTTQKRGARMKAARAKAQNSVSSKTAILVAAEKLFASQGFRDATLLEIARASGVNSALVAYYYGSKSGLLKAVIEARIDRSEAISNIPDGEPVTSETLRQVVRKVLKVIHQDELFYRITNRIFVEDHELRALLLKRVWQKYFDFIKDIIQRIHNGSLKDHEAETRCFVIVGLMLQYAHLKHFTIDAYQLTQSPAQALANYENYFASAIVDTICRAIS